ncbi:MAG: hypothetical protein BZ138_07825 [Methanosphaera sp. rholeuAM270]|nr:MAG: hypothetical protein BZ138_07825 [Methanosphaera sp. rholeuAM270]
MINNNIFKADSVIEFNDYTEPQIEEEYGVNELRIPSEDNPYTPEEQKVLDIYLQRWNREFKKVKEQAYEEAWGLFLNEYPEHSLIQHIPSIKWDDIKLAIDNCMGYDDDIFYGFYVPTVFSRLNETLLNW